MDAAMYLIAHAFITHIKPYPFLLLVLLLLAVAIRFGWNIANDLRTRRRVGQRFNRIR